MARVHHPSPDLEPMHCRAICDEIGERLRTTLTGTDRPYLCICADCWIGLFRWTGERGWAPPTEAVLVFHMLCMFGQLSPLLGDLKISLLRTGIACSRRQSFGFFGSLPVFFRTFHADALRSAHCGLRPNGEAEEPASNLIHINEKARPAGLMRTGNHPSQNMPD
jgi:hypothetical protein